MGGIDVQEEEFSRTLDAIVGTTIFVTDKTRSWGNAFDFSAVQQQIAGMIEGKSLHAIGNSMGGYLAVLSSHFFDIETCIAFSPQYSIDPEIVPKEKRWRKYREHIKQIRYPSLGAYINQTTRYHLFFGDDARETYHANLFPDLPNISKTVFADTNHTLVRHLKDNKTLYPLIKNCFIKEKT